MRRSLSCRLLLAAWLSAAPFAAPAASGAVEPIRILTETDYREKPPLFFSGDPSKYWAEVKPDEALKSKLAAYERALHWANQRYVQAGFEPGEILARTKNKGGQPAVFYLDFRQGWSSGANAFAGPAFGTTSIWFNHNAFKHRTHTANLYTVAHELMHRVIGPLGAKHDLWEGGAAGKWIGEGIPDAAAFLVLEGFEGVNFKSYVADGSRDAVRVLGARYLDYPLHLDPAYPPPTRDLWFTALGSEGTPVLMGYWTSSFWRQVSRKAGGLRFFKRLLDRTKPPGSAPAHWLNWVEKGIQESGHYANLAEAYDDYVGSLMDYPYDEKTSESGYFKWGTWQDDILFHGGCPVIGVQAGARPEPFVVSVRPAASACVRVKPQGVEPGEASILVTLTQASDRDCRDLSVLSGRKKALQKPVPKANGSCDWHWEYPYQPVSKNANGEQVFVITNLDPNKPSATPHRKHVTLLFSVPAAEVEGSGQVSASSTAGGAASGPSHGLPPATATRKLKVKPKKPGAKALQPLPPISDSHLEAPSRHAGSECTAEQRQTSYCGPMTTIELPFGTDLELAQAASRVRFETVSGAIANAGDSSILALARRAAAAGGDGGKLVLRFPRLEPGQTGRFDRATITLSVREGGAEASLESLSPDYLRPGPYPGCGHASALYRYAGVVEVESVTAAGVQGRFSADFYEAPEQGCPVPFKVASVSGRFHSGVLNDEAQDEFEDSEAGRRRLDALLDAKFHSLVPPELSAGVNRYQLWQQAKARFAAGGRGSAGSAVLAGPAGPDCRCDCREFADLARRSACSAQCAHYPNALMCVVEREQAAGRGATLDARASACPEDCAGLRGIQGFCADLRWPQKTLCEATPAGGVRGSDIDCIAAFLGRGVEPPQRQLYIEPLIAQLRSADPESQAMLVGPYLEQIRSEGFRCP